MLFLVELFLHSTGKVFTVESEKGIAVRGVLDGEFGVEFAMN